MFVVKKELYPYKIYLFWRVFVIIIFGFFSILVMVLYVYVNYKFMISTEINQVVDTVLKNLK
jgi:predicted membrane protein